MLPLPSRTLTYLPSAQGFLKTIFLILFLIDKILPPLEFLLKIGKLTQKHDHTANGAHKDRLRYRLNSAEGFRNILLNDIY